MSEQIEIVRRIARQFAQEFVENPYLCYTEHGLHALFFTRLYNALPGELQYAEWKGQKVCLVQKEYPTAEALGKSKRQHWDIAVLKAPLTPAVGCNALSYDCFELAAAVEFGLNETQKHLAEDIRRLTHRDAHVEQGFTVHLYRLSVPGAEISSRQDEKPGWSQILFPEYVADLARNSLVEVLYGLHHGADRDACGVWRIERGEARYWPRHMEILEEYFQVQPKETWTYSFRPKEGAGWAAKPSTRIARTSAQGKNLFLFTAGELQRARDGLDCRLTQIIQKHGLRSEREETTAGNRDATYVGFDLSSKACTPEKLRSILEDARLAVADCSEQKGIHL